jgi:adenine-specific DNA-methyltransferase
MSPAEKTTNPTTVTNVELERLAMRSEDIVADKQAELAKLFPEAVTEGGKIDFERLRLVIGQAVDIGKERYGMNWPGKADCFRTIQKPSIGTLRPSSDESVNCDTTENLIIEGDNLEVLKLLQKSYLGKIKMIYIDPPYNTGNDFIYPDNYSESLETYLEYTGQADDEGKKFGTNPDSDGRFHSRWMSMLHPRLYLARNLLRDDGVIFISIGDQELHGLRVLMNDVFGEENYINTICVKAKPSAGASGGGEDKRLKKNVEFLLAYVKNRDSETALDLNQAFDETEISEHIAFMREEDKSWKYTRALTDFGRRAEIATTVDGDGNQIKLFRHSEFVMKPLSQLQKPGQSEADTYREYFPCVFRDTNAQSSIRTRVMEALGTEDGLFSIEYIPRSGRNKGKLTTVYYKGVNKDQIAWLKDIGRRDGDKVWIRGKTGTLWEDFNWNNVSKEGDVAFPNGKKPIAFIQRMLQLATKPSENHIVLDFFAGSGSTAHAVIASNEDDRGNRQFILVQLPEPLPNPEQGLESIADICKARVRRVLQALNANDTNGKLDLNNGQKTDRGFSVFKLAASNFMPWDAAASKDANGLAQQLELHVDHIRQNRAASDILYEILLKSGFPLTIPAEEKVVAATTLYLIAGGALIICLEKQLTLDLIRAIADMRPERVVLLDEGFASNDQLKANAVQTFRTKGVTSFKTV